ncbi:Alpha/beta hydrolase family-domain-containing protein [Apodospora peruviana]|uniref:Alpha/beta hydrolase family-domain-containing protein n=1 Tax=Apodospora peruviana TaxID=516989 RepID=A0AAE0M205_9PEZI|nr:Alpha/beta hydrolase family-domain-containing protein [Apodospora peruviana]
MASSFTIKEHVVQAQHIREYPHATAHSQEEVLYLSFKQYIPKSNPTAQLGDITILASHANGFIKELYEPLWEDLVAALGRRGVRVRGIWIADVAWQGQSGIINENNLGNDPSWFDHARDLLLATNHFRKEMPRPIIGVGHSFGANIMVNLALLHPRLLSSLVLLDPVLSRFNLRGPKYGLAPMVNSVYRRDLWPSLETAVASFTRNKFYSTWDPRVLAAWNAHGLRPAPGTKLHPDAPSGSVTLTTSKHQEVFTYYRPLAQVYDPSTGKRVPENVDLSKLPDVDPSSVAKHPDFMFYRVEGGPATVDKLPQLRPGALWLFGGKSDVNPPDVRQEKMDLTGIGVGGSGGEKAGRVKQVTIEEFGHLVPMEATTRCAEYAAEFIAGDIHVWREEDKEYRAWAEGNTDTDKQMIGREYFEQGWIEQRGKKAKL